MIESSAEGSGVCNDGSIQLNLWRYSAMRLRSIIIGASIIICFNFGSGKTLAQVGERPDSMTSQTLLTVSESTKKENAQRILFNGKRRVDIAADRLLRLEPNLIVTLTGPKYAETLAAIANLGYRIESTKFSGTYLIHLELVSAAVKRANVIPPKARDVFELSLQLEPIGGIDLIELNDRLQLGYR